MNSSLKISTRITIWYVSSLGIILLGGSFVLYQMYETQSRARVDEELERSADMLASLMKPEPREVSTIFDELIRTTKNTKARDHGHRFAIASGDSLFSETTISSTVDSLVHSWRSGPGLSARGFRTVNIGDTEYRTYARGISRPGRDNLTLIILTSTEKLRESQEQLQSIILILVPLALFLAGGGGWWFARRALQPLRSVITTASEITSASLDRHVPLGKSGDELTQLAVTFNAMIDRLNSTFQTMQQFIADASHDLRTPLTVLQMELELLLLQADIHERSHPALERCLIEVERLSTLAADLLLLARADANQLSLEKKEFRLDELLVECVSQLRRLAEGRQVRLAVTIADPVEIEADEGFIRRALMNVLDNALTHTLPQTVVATDLKLESSWVCISITDHGEGLADDQIDKVFQRFQRGDNSRSRKGTGLGLAIVKAIIEAHGGNVAMTSQVHAGTTVSLYLPFSRSESKPEC